MFCLREQISSQPIRIGAVISKNKYLTWTGYHINSDFSLYKLFGSRHKNITRARYDIDGRDLFGTIRHCCNSPRTADAVHFGNIEKICCRKYMSIQSTIVLRGSDYNNFLNTCDLGGNGCHEKGRNKRSIAAFASRNV